MTIYHTLVTKDDADSEWAIAFGDYDKQVVLDEKDDSAGQNHRAMIISTDEGQQAILAAVLALNSDKDDTYYPLTSPSKFAVECVNSHDGDAVAALEDFKEGAEEFERLPGISADYVAKVVQALELLQPSTHELIARLVGSLSYAVDALQAPEASKIRDTLKAGRAFLGVRELEAKAATVAPKPPSTKECGDVNPDELSVKVRLDERNVIDANGTTVPWVIMHHSAGYELAGSCMRYTDAKYSVTYANANGGRNGRTFQRLENAKAEFDAKKSSPARDFKLAYTDNAGTIYQFEIMADSTGSVYVHSNSMREVSGFRDCFQTECRSNEHEARQAITDTMAAQGCTRYRKGG